MSEEAPRGLKEDISMIKNSELEEVISPTRTKKDLNVDFNFIYTYLPLVQIKRT